MGKIEVARWNKVDFLIPKHLRKSKIGLLEQIWAKNPYVTFFLGQLVYWQILYLAIKYYFIADTLYFHFNQAAEILEMT